MALTENDVVQAVAARLRSDGYRIDRALSTTEHGIDIVGVHERTNRKIFVEAKGGTSSKATTNRYGQGFTPNQAKSHVSVALYCAARLHETADAEDADIALAFPDDPAHRKLLKNISKALRALDVAVYFVGADYTMTSIESPVSAQQGAHRNGPNNGPSGELWRWTELSRRSGLRRSRAAGS
jgi:hypothetical protein